MAAKKVSNQINHINKSNSVLIVSGRQAAKIYELRQGRIVADPAITIENPKYSDHEGFNMRRGKGTVYGTASAHESKDDGVVTDFLHQLEKEAKTLQQSRDFDAVYLFAPSECFQTVKNALPQNWVKKIQFEYRGNFTKFAPDRLLEKITIKSENQKNSRRIDLKPEPRKILKRKKVKQSGRS